MAHLTDAVQDRQRLKMNSDTQKKPNITPNQDAYLKQRAKELWPIVKELLIMRGQFTPKQP